MKKWFPQRWIGWHAGNRFKETHINRAFRKVGNDTYVEIGIRDGSCFKKVEAKTRIGIDIDLSHFSSESRERDRLFEMPSDAFFKGHAARLLGPTGINVALVDGLHEFEQTLRDILNLEPYMKSDGYVFVHDCNPPSRKHAGKIYAGPWNGDVWKIAPYLQTYRPDLDFFTLDCDWGLGVISGFGKKTVYPSDSNHISECKALDYDILRARRKTLLNLKPPLYFVWHLMTTGRSTPANRLP